MAGRNRQATRQGVAGGVHSGLYTGPDRPSEIPGGAGTRTAAESHRMTKTGVAVWRRIAYGPQSWHVRKAGTRRAVVSRRPVAGPPGVAGCATRAILKRCAGSATGNQPGRNWSPRGCANRGGSVVGIGPRRRNLHSTKGNEMEFVAGIIFAMSVHMWVVATCERADREC